LSCDAGAWRPVTAMHRQCMAVTGLDAPASRTKVFCALFYKKALLA
jgi:hypothetical protein